MADIIDFVAVKVAQQTQSRNVIPLSVRPRGMISIWQDPHGLWRSITSARLATLWGRLNTVSAQRLKLVAVRV
jgi:hypothetical protein